MAPSADLKKFVKGQMEKLVGMALDEVVDECIDKDPDDLQGFLEMFG